MTIEDPIEVLHPDKQSIINQREVGTDTDDFPGAPCARVLRQDPDVILIGEMRDPETVWAALSAAETGHLVFSTLHTMGAAETINRIIDFFPPYQQQQVRAMLAGTLKGIVSQRLVQRRRPRRPRAGDGGARRDRPRLRQDRRPDADRTSSRRSSPTASTTGCRPSTRASSRHV